MAFDDARIFAQVAVSDEARAREFYVGKLGLTRVPDPVLVVRCDVPSTAETVEALTAAAVTFERYGELATDDMGIHDSGYGMIACFTDPDGNTLAIEEVP